MVLPLKDLKPGDRILVIRIGALGDVADTAVAVAQLKDRYPGVLVDWVVKDSFVPIIEDFCDRTIKFSSKKNFSEFLKELRKEKYQAVIDYHANFRSALIAWLSRSKKRYGFTSSNSREAASLFYNQRFQVPEGVHSRIDDGLMLTSSVLGEQLVYKPLTFVESDQNIAFAEKELRDGFDILLVTSSSPKGFHKMWPAERWRHFLKKAPDSWKFTLIWGPGEEEAVRAIARGFEKKARVSSPTKLKDLQALIKRSRMVIGADTGPMHLAHLSGVPTLVLFGPKDPRRYGPQFNDYRVIYRKQKCSPCRNWRCDHISCMWAIDTPSVIEAAKELI